MSTRAQNARVLRFPVISDSPHGAVQALKTQRVSGQLPLAPPSEHVRRVTSYRRETSSAFIQDLVNKLFGSQVLVCFDHWPDC